MREIKAEPFDVIGFEDGEDFRDFSEFDRFRALQVPVFKSLTAEYFKKVLPLLDLDSFGDYGDRVKMINEIERLREIEEVLSDNLCKVWQVVNILRVVYLAEDLEKINMSNFLDGLILLIEHNIMTEYIEGFCEKYKEKYKEKLGFLNNYGYIENEDKEVNN